MARGRKRRNQLQISSIEGGTAFLLHGYFLGERIRQRNRDVAPLQDAKARMEAQLSGSDGSQGRPVLAQRLTRLTEDQLHEAEIAFEIAGSRKLLDLVKLGDGIWVDGKPVRIAWAYKEWMADLMLRQRAAVTLAKNRSRLRSFIRSLKVKLVTEVTSEMVEEWVLRKPGAPGYTILTDAAVVKAFTSFWLKKKWVKVTPCEVNMKDLKARARPKGRPQILTPEQCRSLMVESMKEGLEMATYTALTTWCFLRHSEAIRTTAADLKLEAVRPMVDVWPVKRGTPSYRNVDVPDCVIEILRAANKRARSGKSKVARCPRKPWARIRAAVGLVRLGKLQKKNRWRKVTPILWEEHILRHSGLSYHYQRDGNIQETTRQAGNTKATAFGHYLNLPALGAQEKFYAPFKEK